MYFLLITIQYHINKGNIILITDTVEPQDIFCLLLIYIVFAILFDFNYYYLNLKVLFFSKKRL